MSNQLQVVIAVIISQGQTLVAWRDEKLHQGGCYEFPGGKVEVGETPEQALRREVQEETGLDINISRCLAHFCFDYPDRSLQLLFYRCGLARANSRCTQWQWISLAQLADLSFPAANQAILKRLHWPKTLHRGGAEHTQQLNGQLYDLAASVAHVEQRLSQNLQSTIIADVAVFVQLSPAQQQQIFAIHVQAAQLHQPEIAQLGQQYSLLASCGTPTDLELVRRDRCDAILLTQVGGESVHPDQGFAWGDVARYAAQLDDVLIYVDASLQSSTLQTAEHYGAYGIVKSPAGLARTV
jgi:8-oxo-dGTP diphosphatase